MPGTKRLSASMGLARAVESAVKIAVDHHLAHGNAEMLSFGNTTRVTPLLLVAQPLATRYFVSTMHKSACEYSSLSPSVCVYCCGFIAHKRNLAAMDRAGELFFTKAKGLYIRDQIVARKLHSLPENWVCYLCYVYVMVLCVLFVSYIWKSMFTLLEMPYSRAHMRAVTL